MAEEQKIDEKPVDEKPVDEKDVDEKPVDQKPADEKPADDKKDSDTKEPDGKAKDEPVKFDLKLPEGSLLKPEAVQVVTDFAKANKMTPEQAQAVLERENANVMEQKKMLDDLSVKWVGEVKADKELGGDNFAKTAELSKRVIDKFAPELVEELEKTGLGNHPGFVRFVYRIGKAMDNGEFVKGSNPPPPIKSAAEVLYGGTSSSTQG
jgi:hypothetical protein